MRNLVIILISAVLFTGCAMKFSTQESNVNNSINSSLTKGSDPKTNSNIMSKSSQRMDQSSYASMYYSIIKSLKNFR